MNDIQSILKSRIMVLDGAMGTMIQRLGLSDADFRGERFADHPVALIGCNDVLCLTRPDVIAAIHREYLEVGADIIETNSFNSNPLSLREYALGSHARKIAFAAAEIARREADRFTEANPAWPRFVAGSMGPGNIALSVGGEATFDQLADAFMEQACGLIEGGTDVLLLETIFDTLNAKAAIYGIEKAFDRCGKRLPVMLSATLSENGRLLSGQTPEAFLASVAHIRPLSVGFNCGFGPDKLVPFVKRLSTVSPYYVSLYPNAGLPDGCGHYHTSPEQLGDALKEALDSCLINIIGGCCGTTPAHIATLAALARQGRARPLPSRGDALELSGLEPLAVEKTFVKVGERCNVAGSRKFLRLIKEGNHAEALEIAAAQITKGAGVIDVNMDDGLLDASAEMNRFVELLGADADIAKVPVMLDSSDFKVLSSALRHIQGRPAVNSISLKNGEETFVNQAHEIRRLGAAVIVMAFDEQGQADTLQRRIEVCERAYRLLTEKCGFSGNEIIFDPNILAVATGIEAHARYALDFLEATAWIKANLPGARVSGGVSNLSFAFRGNNAVREAMHSVFLSLAIERGLDMAIVNPSTKLTTDWIDSKLRESVEDVLLCRHRDATDRLVALAEEIKSHSEETVPKKKQIISPAPESPDTILAHMVEHGLDFDAQSLMPGVLEKAGSAMNVINGVLMKAMDRVGNRFAAGDMFLPQVVRAAATMKRAVEWLTPVIEAEKGLGNQTSTAGKFVLATVKGDVHDIGKNIVAVVLRCSGYDVVDLGVMVEAKDIVDTAQRENATFVGLSGLITPSLAEMARVASEMECRGMKIPLFIGGATTSDIHAAVRVAPYYSGPVVHSGDAASLPAAAAAFAPGPGYDAAVEAANELNRKLLDNFAASQPLLSLEEALSRAPEPCAPAPHPASSGIVDLKFGLDQLVPLVNWNAFLGEWGIDPAKATDPESRRVVADAHVILASLENMEVSARVAIESAHRDGDDIVVDSKGISIPVLRSQTANPVTGATVALSDFVSPNADHVAFFAVTLARTPIYDMIAAADDAGDDYRSLLLQIMSHRLAEAATEALHRHVNAVLWTGAKGIRPAIGYPSLPDQSLVNEFDKILDYRSLGIKPTDTGALWPSATTTGIIIANPSARYFSVGALGSDQLADYARRRRLSPDELKPFLASVRRD